MANDEAKNQGLADESRLMLLRQEADHFFQAELYHDQRASWLLALASGLLTLVLGALLAMNDGKLAKGGRSFIIIAATSFGIAILFALFALWPISGRTGRLWNPLRKHSSRQESCGLGLTVQAHYEAHRLRAAIKANRIVLVIVALVAGVAFGLCGILMSLEC